MASNIIDIEAVINTNDEATSCKRSAIHANYWDDQFVALFCRDVIKRPPEINRGYFYRVTVIDYIIKDFLSRNCATQPQILILGAGFDTLYWRLANNNNNNNNMPIIFEVDFPQVTSRKCLIIKNKPKLSDLCGAYAITEHCTNFTSLHYKIIGTDISQIDQLQCKLIAAGFHFDKPTLILCECVLVYIPASSVIGLCGWLANSINTCVFVSYSPFNLNDSFGDVMKKNLATSGCNLAGQELCASASKQYKMCEKFTKSICLTMEAAISKMIGEDEQKRINKLEFLDELEPLKQLNNHYCVTIAVNDNSNMGLIDMVTSYQ